MSNLSGISKHSSSPKHWESRVFNLLWSVLCPGPWLISVSERLWICTPIKKDPDPHLNVCPWSTMVTLKCLGLFHCCCILQIWLSGISGFTCLCQQWSKSLHANFCGDVYLASDGCTADPWILTERTLLCTPQHMNLCWCWSCNCLSWLFWQLCKVCALILLHSIRVRTLLAHNDLDYSCKSWAVIFFQDQQINQTLLAQ